MVDVVKGLSRVQLGERGVMKQCESGWHIVGDGTTLKSRS